MSVAFAVFTSDPNLLKCELLRLEGEVVGGESLSSNAVGVGSYAQDEILFQRFPSPLDLHTLSRRWAGSESAALLYHASELPLGRSSEENTQPFRYGKWMFCQTGARGDLPAVRVRLTSLLPDFLRRQIRGESVSELIFAVFLKMVRDFGGMDDEVVRPEQAAELLGRTVRLIDEAWAKAGGRSAALNCIATDGSLLVATRYGNEPFYYRLLEGSRRCERCGIDASTLETHPLLRAHRRRRTVALASHPTHPSSWIEIQSGSAIAIGRDLGLQCLAI